MTERLYVIGNGFDLHHGIPSTYREFARFLERSDRSVYRLIDRYFAVDSSFWFAFEERLAEFDEQQAVDDCSQFLDDKGGGDFQYELQQIADGLTDGLREEFSRWVRSLRIPWLAEVANPVSLDADALFLTFNYTATLERTYGIALDQILHIHGSAEALDDKLVLGHAWERRPEDSLNFKPDGPDDDWRVRDGIEYIDEYFAATLKPTAEIIARNAPFFTRIAPVREIVILGHSLAEVDQPYIEAIMDKVDLQRTRWVISAFGDLDDRKTRFGAYGLPDHLVTYREMSEM